MWFLGARGMWKEAGGAELSREGGERRLGSALLSRSGEGKRGGGGGRRPVGVAKPEKVDPSGRRCRSRGEEGGRFRTRLGGGRGHRRRLKEELRVGL